ncbi:hypothetical protein [Nostoc flagelliforme]|uniref:hypothetical protein n=1 Tax=Nostoc flagelliforme TaxID=1306274 RepID=UPI000C2D1393|nr:hypothetical protein [Nostoc flagelliforme]
MASLSNPALQIDLLTGTSNANVTATVRVTLDQLDTFLLSGGLTLQLSSKLVGDDSGLTGADDDLFFFPSQNITNTGIYTFQSTVSLGTLDEDNGGDEVFANFNLKSLNNIFPLNTSVNSPNIEGSF